MPLPNMYRKNLTNGIKAGFGVILNLCQKYINKALRKNDLIKYCKSKQ